MVQSAPSMKKSKSIRVLVLLSQTLKAARDEISGVLRAASRRPDLDVRILNRNLPPKALRERLAAWTPHGIITDNRGSVPAILPESRPNCMTLKAGRIRHIPIVYLDFVCPSASSVCVDNAAIGKCAADFLLRRKYEHFAFAGTNLRHTAGHSQARFDAFKNALFFRLVSVLFLLTAKITYYADYCTNNSDNTSDRCYNSACRHNGVLTLSLF